MSDYIAKQGDGYGVYSLYELITDQNQNTSTNMSQQVKTTSIQAGLSETFGEI